MTEQIVEKQDETQDQVSETESIELVFDDLDNAASIWGVARRC